MATQTLVTQHWHFICAWNGISPSLSTSLSEGKHREHQDPLGKLTIMLGWTRTVITVFGTDIFRQGADVPDSRLFPSHFLSTAYIIPSDANSHSQLPISTLSNQLENAISCAIPVLTYVLLTKYPLHDQPGTHVERGLWFCLLSRKLLLFKMS